MPAKDFGGTSTSGNHDPTTLAHPSLVATTVENVNCNPICVAEAGEPTFTITFSSNTTPLKEEIDYAGMSPVWQSIQDRGISEAAAKLIMASWRDGTKKQYSTYITKWQKFCNQRQISHIQPSVVPVLEFLTLLYQQGLTYSAINTARSALSSYITLETGTCVGKHPLVSRLMKGIFQEKPPRPKYTENWDVSIVLSYLQSLSPVDKLSLKELTLNLVVLILLVSGQRGQTVHLLSIDHMVSVNSCYTFQIVAHLKQSRPGVKNPLVELRPFEDKTLCVVTTLKEYLTRTQSLRGSESQLFISYNRPFRRVSRETISRWVKLVLTDAGIDTSRFKPHSTRAASTSAANNASVSLDDILHTAGWSSESTFAKFYNKPIVKENTFADKVLSTVSNTTVQ